MSKEKLKAEISALKEELTWKEDILAELSTSSVRRRGGSADGSTPPPPITSLPKKYTMLNCITWREGTLDKIPINDADEFTYFVLPVSSEGTLLIGNKSADEADDAKEKKFIADVHRAGKKATLSIAGGAQPDHADIAKVLVNKGNILISNIVNRINNLGYDGVILDIEHTHASGLAPNVIPDFVNKLRTMLGGEKIIGMYTQPEEFYTSHKAIELAKDSLTWLSVMIYDAGYYDLNTFLNQSRPWAEKVGKDKYLAGVAVNYPEKSGGLNPAQFEEVLTAVIKEGWKGVGIWQDTIFTEPWREIRRIKIM